MPPSVELPRRALLTGGLALLALPALAAAPPGGRLAFDVWRKDRKIGEHIVTFSSEGDATVTRVAVRMAVAIGPVTVFRYRHNQLERWKDGQFDSLVTDSTTNGSKSHVAASRTAAGVVIDSSKGKRTLAANALPLTHWNRKALSGPLFNPETGKLMRLSISRQGPAPAQLASGKAVSATRVSLAGETSIDDWYDDSGVWTALRARADDGSIIEYRRT